MAALLLIPLVAGLRSRRLASPAGGYGQDAEPGVDGPRAPRREGGLSGSARGDRESGTRPRPNLPRRRGSRERADSAVSAAAPAGPQERKDGAARGGDAEAVRRLAQEAANASAAERHRLLQELGRGLADAETGDLALLSEIAGQLPADADLRQVLFSYFQRLGETDAALGLVLAQEVQNRLRLMTTRGTAHVFGPTDAMRATLRGWAAVDLAGAAGWVSQMPASSTQQALANELVVAWVPVAPAEAARWALGLSAGSSSATQLAATLWAQRDLEGALRFLDGLDVGPARDAFTQGLMSTLSRKQPEQALALLQDITPGPARDSAAMNLVIGLSGTDPRTAARWALTLLDPGRSAGAFVHVIRSWAGTDARAAGAFISSLQDAALRERLWEAGAEALVASDPNLAYTWIRQIASAAQRSQATESFVVAWARSNPAAAADWATQLAGAERSTAYANIALQWARRDRDGTVQWLQALPEQPARYNAILAYATTYVDFPDQASLEAARSAMRRADLTRADALAWVATSGLTEAQRQEILRLF
jgi:hypothetical protein